MEENLKKGVKLAVEYQVRNVVIAFEISHKANMEVGSLFVKFGTYIPSSSEWRMEMNRVFHFCFQLISIAVSCLLFLHDFGWFWLIVDLGRCSKVPT